MQNNFSSQTDLNAKRGGKKCNDHFGNSWDCGKRHSQKFVRFSARSHNPRLILSSGCNAPLLRAALDL
jgi:hypothetical protein